MAKRRRESQAGFGKLLDAWIPPDLAGDPIGCIATTFTFNAAFFEEECLATFLALESEPNEDGPAYLIEREEKLAKLSCAVVLVDAHHCRGSRNLRWDLLPARLPGIQHAKVSLLVWTNHVRLIIGSANLTEDGYRRNLEVYGVLDYHEGGDSPIQCLMESTAFLGRIVQYGVSPTGTESPSAKRWNGLLSHVNTQCTAWGMTNDSLKGSAVRVQTLFIEPNQPLERSCFRQLQAIWPGNTLPRTANIVSPFFDLPESPNLPATEILTVLRKRGEVAVGYHVTGEDVPDTMEKEKSIVLLHAPSSLAKQTGRDNCEIEFFRISPPESRPLHAKGIWLEDDRWVLYQIGSSNFTSAGTGLSKRCNIEANLVFLVDSGRDALAYESFERTFPSSELLDECNIQWKPMPNSDEELAEELVFLSAFFGDATYCMDGGKNSFVVLEFHGTTPQAFQLYIEGDDTVWFDFVRWEQLGSPTVCRLPWDRVRPPSGFEVQLEGKSGTAWWPVNALSTDSLPPPDELSDLPLEILIELLTSARPLHRQLSEFLRRKNKKQQGAMTEAVVDPHKRVDTSRFLLQRTRRLSWALAKLRERIERPAATIEVLHWRLRGPVGVMALADAISREAMSAEESIFLLTELALELARAKFSQTIGCISPDVQRDEVQRVIQELKNRVDENGIQGPENLSFYVRSVFAEVCL